MKIIKKAAVITGTALLGVLAGGLAVRAASGRPAREPGCVAVVGASIATGYPAGTETAWPDLTQRHFAGTGSPVCIRNYGIGATRLLLTMPDLPSYLDRQTAVLADPGVRTILLTDLINDIQALPHQYDPQVIIDGVRRFVAIAHRRGVQVIATTITPYGGYHYTGEQRYTRDGERCRRAVNDALRRGGLVDGYLDFDETLADPAGTSRLRPAYDSGDHLHPSVEGQRALARTVIAIVAAVG